VTTGTVIKVFDYASKSVLGWGIAGQHPSWSPDGTRIALVQQFGGSLRVINAADGSGQRVISPANRTYTEGSISWSADSRWVLAKSNAGTLDLIEVDTGTMLPLGYTTSFQSGSLK
jgi:Tol biopolymer transport system component